VEEQEKTKARDKVRADLARAAKTVEQIRSEDDISDIPPHMLGR
jgi:hypothetical protein